MIRTAVVGYGNIGRFAIQAVNAAADMTLAGVIRRKESLAEPLPPELGDVNVVSSIKELDTVDVALLCTPTRSVPAGAAEILKQGIHTVDSYDIHGELADLRAELDTIAKEHQAVSVLSAGWDPGTDSIVRAMLELMAPHGITDTNFGPGMSMGHTVAVKAIAGVKDALSMTVPSGSGLHRRQVYVELEPDVAFDTIASTIKNDPYFVNDETHVTPVSDVKALIDMGHGVHMERKGVSGATHNQLFAWKMNINNPALTAQVMAASARASTRQQPGAYTMVEIPVIDFLPGDREAIIRRLV